VEAGAYQHIRAIIAAIDQHVEAATGNREFFHDKPHGLDGGSPG